jgi:hypothetical protein
MRELRAPLPPHNNGTEAVMYWSSSEQLDCPDMFARATAEHMASYGIPDQPGHSSARPRTELLRATPWHRVVIGEQAADFVKRTQHL